MQGIDADTLRHAALDARMGTARAASASDPGELPAGAQQQFLDDLAMGRRRLPAPDYPPHDFSQARRELAAVAEGADPAHPAGAYLRESARSWDIAAQLLESLGRPAAGAHAVALYGSPDQPLPGHGPTTREAARHFIDIADELDHDCSRRPSRCRSRRVRSSCSCRATLDAFFSAPGGRGRAGRGADRQERGGRLPPPPARWRGSSGYDRRPAVSTTSLWCIR